jgi:hypothetical protein
VRKRKIKTHLLKNCENLWLSFWGYVGGLKVNLELFRMNLRFSSWLMEVAGWLEGFRVN